MRNPQVRLAALGVVVLVAGILAFGLATRPPAPAPTVQVASLDEAVALGLLDAEVRQGIRENGEARALVHLDVEAILRPIRQTVGEDRTAVLIDAMTAAFKANKAALFAGLGPDVAILEDFDRLGAAVVTIRSEDALLAALRSQFVNAVTADRLFELDRDDPSEATAPLERMAPGIFDGAGVAVGVLDTGADAARYPEYFPAGSIAGTFEAAPEDFAADDGVHGSHVSSTVLRVAPQARLYVADVFQLVKVTGEVELQHRAPASATLAAMDWLIGLKQSGVNLRAVNLSLGHGHYPPSICVDINHFAEAFAAGIIPVVSAGNSAFKDDLGRPTTVFQSGMGSNACNDTTLSVGAVTNGSCADGSVDQVARFSQSGPALDILAPGMCIVAAGGALNGTSMAAPHVTGAVAVLASARAATPYEVWNALVSTGPLITDPNSGVVRHRLDVDAAVNALVGSTGAVPTPDPGVVRGVAVGVTTASPVEALSPGESFDFDPIAVRNIGTVGAIYDAGIGPSSSAFVTTAPAFWFSVAPSAVALEPGALGEVRVRVSVPEGTAAGVYAAELRIGDREGSGGDAVKVVELSFVVFADSGGSTGTGSGTGSGSGSGGSGGTGGSFVDDLGELLDNPLVILVGIVLVIWALRRRFGGSRRPA